MPPMPLDVSAAVVGGSKIARTFDFRGQDAIISTTTNYPNNYVESADNAEEFNYSESTNYPMIDKSTDDQSCLAMFVPPKATDMIEESNWGNDASMNYFMSDKLIGPTAWKSVQGHLLYHL